MQKYDIKKGHFKYIEGGGLKELMKDIFGEVNEVNEKLETSYGALNCLIVWTEDKKLCVETKMNKDVDDAVALDTIKAYNKFLESATGYTSKERRVRLTKKAREGKL